MLTRAVFLRRLAGLVLVAPTLLSRVHHAFAAGRADEPSPGRSNAPTAVPTICQRSQRPSATRPLPNRRPPPCHR